MDLSNLLQGTSKKNKHSLKIPDSPKDTGSLSYDGKRNAGTHELINRICADWANGKYLHERSL